MPLALNRELTPITTQAHQHMKRIVSAHKRKGLPETNTHWLSELILSQPLPTNGNGHAKSVVVSAPVRTAEGGDGIPQLEGV